MGDSLLERDIGFDSELDELDELDAIGGGEAKEATPFFNASVAT